MISKNHEIWYYELDTATKKKYVNGIPIGIHKSDECFGPLLTEPQLHQCGTFDSCNRYMNCPSKKMYVISMHPAK